MNRSARVRRNGEMLGILLPAEVVEGLRLREDEDVHFVETEGGWLLTRNVPGLEDAMAIFDRGSRKYSGALRTLAER